jgi:hypothetical protein
MIPAESEPLILAAMPVLRETHVEDLLGRRLRDVNGVPVGRIEELVAEIRGTDVVVVELHLGPGAFLERVTDFAGRIPPLGPLRRFASERYRVAWHQLDLTDPDRPRLSVGKHELDHI